MDQPTKIDLTAKAQALMHLHDSANTYLSSQHGLFNPGTPATPWFGDDSPHLYQYQPGINLITTPRMGMGVLPFGALRALGSASKEIRLNIELIKRQIRGFQWEIVPNKRYQQYKTGAVEVDGTVYRKTVEVQSVVDFFESPDLANDWDAWINMLIEELLVTDAVTLYPSSDPATGRFILEIIDGTTIKPLIDMRGAAPKPPLPAFLQILHGIPSTHYPSNALIYRPLNTKVYTPYGESPIEWVLTAINTAIRLDAQRIGYFTDGNIPSAFGFLPESWSTEQIEVWRQYFDALIKGDINKANKIVWLPGGGSASNPVYPFQNKGDMQKIEVDKFLMEVACWAFGNAPAEFGIVPGAGLGGKSFMTASGELQMRSMVWPITGYLVSLFDMVVRKYLKRPDLKFQWVGLDPVPDKLNMAQVDQIYIGMGAYDMEYVQDRLGVPENFRPAGLPMPPAAKTPGSAPKTASPGTDNIYFTRAVKGDLNLWKEKTTRALKKGWGLPIFNSEVIPAELMSEIKQDLKQAQTVEQAALIFERASEGLDKRQAVPGGDGENTFFRTGRAVYP